MRRFGGIPCGCEQVRLASRAGFVPVEGVRICRPNETWCAVDPACWKGADKDSVSFSSEFPRFLTCSVIFVIFAYFRPYSVLYFGALVFYFRVAVFYSRQPVLYFRFPLFLDLFSRSAGSLLFNMSVKMGQIKPSSPFLAHFHFRFTARLIELGYLGVTLSKKAKSSDVLRKSGKLSPWGLFSGGLQKLSQSGHQVGRFGHRVCESQQKCADYNTFLPPDAQKCSGEGLATRRWFPNPPPCT